MKNHKPDWYARLRKGPFGETVFDSKMQQEVEARTRPGWAKSSKSRLNPRAASLVAAVFLMVAVVLVPALNREINSFYRTNGNGGSGDEPAMSIKYVMDHLQAGMSEDEVKRAFGNGFVEQSVRRDFPQDHKEDPNDMSTWSAVDLWRYDFGVRDGYEAAQGDGTENTDNGFDLPGILNRDVESQLVIYWRENQVERVIFKTLDVEGALSTTQIGPGVEAAESPTTDVPPTTDAPNYPEMPTPNEGVRAVGNTSFGLFQLRPKKRISCN